MSNILDAIYNIVNFQNFEIKNLYSGENRANNMGEALENYIKDSFAGTFSIDNEQERMQIFSQTFSWLGSQNNPPDIIIKNGDAIEVKKTEKANSSLALNSSYPKDMIYSNSPMITQACRDCEEWDKKDLIYTIGHTSNESLKSLWLIYGSIYAAKQETYQRIKNTISEGIETIPNVVLSETKELGRVNHVDPLKITNLRIRGMWQILNPRKVFNYLHEETNNEFELVAIIPKHKYQSFLKQSRQRIENINKDGFSFNDVQVKDPNNPAKLIECALIKFIT